MHIYPFGLGTNTFNQPAEPQEYHAVGRLRRARGQGPRHRASNLSPQAIDEWFRVAEQNGFAKPVALQPQYSLVARGYEEKLADVAKKHGMSVFPYQVLAGGFLTGKYRTESDTEGRARGGAVKGFLTPEGLKVLDALDDVATAHGTDPASVALAWATVDGKITAPLACRHQHRAVGPTLRSHPPPPNRRTGEAVGRGVSLLPLRRALPLNFVAGRLVA